MAADSATSPRVGGDAPSTSERGVAAAGRTLGSSGEQLLPDNRADLVVFEVAGQRYALALSHVQEVLPRAALVPLPEAPGELAGVLRLRGGLLPVVDLRRRLGLPPAPARSNDRIVVALGGPFPVGLLADSVQGLVPAGDADLSEMPEMARPGGAAPFSLVRAVRELPGGAVMVLNAEAIVGDHLAAVLNGALGQASGRSEAGALRQAQGERRGRQVQDER